MDIKAYIESGILEQFVLGLTTPSENLEIERYARLHPEIKAELEIIEKGMADFAQMNAVTPPIALREKILSNLPDGIQNVTPSNTSVNQPSSTPTEKTTNWGMYLALAGCILLGMLAYNFFAGKNNTQDSLDTLQEEYDQLVVDCNEKKTKEADLKQQIALIKDSNSKTIEMKGTDLSPTSLATVYWNDELQKSYLDISDLPAPAPNKQYQLWAIVDGKPVDMGVFDLPIEAGAFKEVTFIAKPQAFAVTLEDTGGVPSPTMEQMYVLGEV